ncbi:MAG TPA: GatB/YqeY domain-containing protein [Vicinamibacterales bacterium]|jgi:hypothetical protein
MSLIEDLTRAIAESMKARDQARLSPLRMLKAALMNREVERGGALTDVEERQVVSTLAKQRRESIEQFAKGGRQDLVDKETAELSVLESYLPPALAPEDLDRFVSEAIAETGAASPKDMGRVMKAVMAKLAGATVDGRTVNELVRRRLAG